MACAGQSALTHSWYHLVYSIFTHRSTVDLNPVVVQMEIAKEVVGGMLATAGKAGIDFCLDAPEKSLGAVRSNPLAGLGGET